MLGGHRPCGRGDVKFSMCHVTSRDHVTRGSWSVCFPHHQSPLWQVCWQLALHKRRYFVLNLSQDLMPSRGERVVWHYGWSPLIINLHPAKFDGHRNCAREEISFFVCHVTPLDFVVRQSYDIMCAFSLPLVTTLKSLMIIDLLGEDILRF